MKRKKRLIPNKKQRVVLSDILPYELPVTFSNRYLYDFLVHNQVGRNGEKIQWLKGDAALNELIKILFGIKTGADENPNLVTDVVMHGEIYSTIHADYKSPTIPFNYKISHKEKDYRELTVIHPKNQLSLIEFYDKYKELILYYSNVSPFSIRKPHKVAKFTFHRDKFHFENLAHDHEHNSTEEFNKEYESLKTFFVYKDMSNIHKFYESYRFHRCEKKYNYLFKFDLSKCFDSIYTHSISWAIFNKGIVKDNVGWSKSTFAGNFDFEMQSMNYGETNGIVIGPEVSRIFAEIILQQIDAHVHSDLLGRNPHILHKTDYETFRYVDDIFLFYNDKDIADDVVNAYRLKLKEFKLYLNDSKSIDYEKPIITGITRAKLKISNLLNDHFDFKEEEIAKGCNDVVAIIDKKYSFYISSNKLITNTKSIIKETNISYGDMLNYTLACIDRKVLKLANIFSKIESKTDHEFKVTKSILEILDYVFFLYSVSPRVNTTIKLCMILGKLTKLAQIKGNFNLDNRHIILKKIYDEISDSLRRNRSKKHTQVETLYLLIALKELGKDYRLSEEALSKYFRINLANSKCDYPLNYFSLVVLLFYIEDKKRYSNLKQVVLEHIKEKFNAVKLENRRKMTELVLLLLDLLACPYLDESYKKRLLDLYEIVPSIQTDLIYKQKIWFTRWLDFDFRKELEAKRSQEVY